MLRDPTREAGDSGRGNIKFAFSLTCQFKVFFLFTYIGRPFPGVFRALILYPDLVWPASDSDLW